MAALLRAPRYFVLIVGGEPFTHPTTPGVPVIFQDEQSALLTGGRLDPSTWPGSVVLEWYGEDLDFLGKRPIQRPISR